MTTGAGHDRNRLGDSGSCPKPEPDDWLAMDKFWHFSASFVTVGAAYHFGRNRVSLSEPLSAGIATGGTITLGLTKEFYDLAGPSRHFSWKDLVADALGVCAGYFAFIHNTRDTEIKGQRDRVEPLRHSIP